MFSDLSYEQVVRTMQIRGTLKDQLDVCRLISNMVSDARYLYDSHEGWGPRNKMRMRNMSRDGGESVQ